MRCAGHAPDRPYPLVALPQTAFILPCLRTRPSPDRRLEHLSPDSPRPPRYTRLSPPQTHLLKAITRGYEAGYKYGSKGGWESGTDSQAREYPRGISTHARARNRPTAMAFLRRLDDGEVATKRGSIF